MMIFPLLSLSLSRSTSFSFAFSAYRIERNARIDIDEGRRERRETGDFSLSLSHC